MNTNNPKDMPIPFEDNGLVVTISKEDFLDLLYEKLDSLTSRSPKYIQMCEDQIKFIKNTMK